MKKNLSKNKIVKVHAGRRSVNLVALILFAFFMSCQRSTETKETVMESQEKTVYYCPMHPEIQQSEPGKCPKPECAGMELVLKESAKYLESALRPVSSAVLSKIRIIQPEYKKVPVEIGALGFMDYDNYSKFDISSRYSGRIDKLYVRYNYQPIKKGDVVFEVYNADLVNGQENLLFLLKNSPSEKTLINAARQKLKLLQLTNEQIAEIESTKKVKMTIPVYSKYDGHIHEMMDSKMKTSEMNDYQKSPVVSVKEGMYVERGKILFNVANPQQVVVMLKIKNTDISKIQRGQKVQFVVNGDSGMLMQGKIDFIEPVFNVASKSMMVRVNIDNKEHRHKIGSLVRAKIVGDFLETLWAPATAIVDLGKDKLAWVWKDGFFKAVKVETGVRSGKWIEITDGLTENDKIASEAHYLSDSESFIKVDENE